MLLTAVNKNVKKSIMTMTLTIPSRAGMLWCVVRNTLHWRNCSTGLHCSGVAETVFIRITCEHFSCVRYLIQKHWQIEKYVQDFYRDHSNSLL